MSTKLKDNYSKQFLTGVAQVLNSIEPSFSVVKFLDLIHDDLWEERELKSRMQHISSVLHTLLPQDYKKAIAILKKAAPLTHTLSKHSGYLCLFYPHFVEEYGLGDWNTSMKAIEIFTQYSSAEFAVRPFIAKDTPKMMAQMLEWSKHPNEHLRRLASEGSRPRLPWGRALNEFKMDPSPILPILETLKNDPSEYVRRSVANSLNDISKDNPELALKIAKKWHGKTINTDRLIKHALRTLLKKANPTALTLFGFGNSNSTTVKTLSLSKSKLPLGDHFTFSFEIDVKEPSTLRLEYGIDFLKANGKHSRKIFQIKESSYKKEKISLTRKHSFRNMTTRKHYPGEHHLALIINGQELKKASFVLIP